MARNTIRSAPKADSGALEESLPENPPVETSLAEASEIEALADETPTVTEEIVSEPSVENTDPSRSANENVEAGGHPTGSVPGGYT